MNDRRNEISDAAEGTCSWLLEDDEYIKWLSEPNGLLFITGKPGAGKSTLLKHVLHKAEYCHPRVHKLVLSFFFHGRGEQLQRRPLGCYRALLHQMLSECPDHLSDIVEGFQKKHANMGEPVKDWYWNQNELQGLLKSCTSEVLETCPIEIMIDAVDECDQVDILARFLKELRKCSSPEPRPRYQLSLCISCRHYPFAVEKLQEFGGKRKIYEICVDKITGRISADISRVTFFV